MRYRELKHIFQGELCGDSSALLVWLFMLGEYEDGLIGCPRSMIASMAGISEEAVNAAVDRFESLGWIERAYGDRPWGWYVTDKARITFSSTRLPFEQWRELRAFVFSRDDYTCFYCNKRGGRLECDHKTPLSRGGSNEPENLITSCLNCNRKKRTKTAEEFMGIPAHV